jgi:transposase-like protein
MLINSIEITCQNPDCDYFMTEPGKRLRRRACQQAGNGHNSAGNQQYHCFHCNAYFVETKHTPLYRSRLDRSQVEFLAKSSVEKVSIRSVSRLTNFDRATVSRYYRLLGGHAALINESHTANIPSGECEMDEIWSFIYKKEKKKCK